MAHEFIAAHMKEQRDNAKVSVLSRALAWMYVVACLLIVGILLTKVVTRTTAACFRFSCLRSSGWWSPC